MIEMLGIISEGIREVATSVEQCRITESLINDMKEMLDLVNPETSLTINSTEATEVSNGSTISEAYLLDNPDIQLDPRSAYIKDGHSFETDDNGLIYKKDGKPIPGVEFSSNGGKYLVDEKGNIEVLKEGYNTELSERLKQTPINSGEWKGLRGDSLFVPDINSSKGRDISSMLSNYGIDGIEYNNAFPDFSRCSEDSVEIEMTDIRYKNFARVDTALAEKWSQEKKNGKSDWKARDVYNYRKENDLTIHECQDMKTCQLVPKPIHEFFTHYGGVCECSNS